MDADELDTDRMEALDLGQRAVAHVMRTLDVLPVVVTVRLDPGVALLQLTKHLGGWYAECPEHGTRLAVTVLQGGRMTMLGWITDPEELCWAIVRELDVDQANELLGEYQAARP